MLLYKLLYQNTNLSKPQSWSPFCIQVNLSPAPGHGVLIAAVLFSISISISISISTSITISITITITISITITVTIAITIA